MIRPSDMMEELLNNSCSNPCYYEVPQIGGGSKRFGDPEDEGYNIHAIELCCVFYEVKAKKVMGHWVIKSFEKRDC
jgi:hypothetical protein